jgi:hypothetical protein
MQGRNRDDSKLSQDPRTIRARIRRRTAKFNDDVDQLMKAQGYKPVSEWSLEELSRGKPKNPETGRWSSGRPTWITPRIQEEVRKRFREETLTGLTRHTTKALKILGELLDSEETDHTGKPIVSAKDKIDVAKFIIEHTIGKPPTKIEIGADESKWRSVLAESVALPGGDTDYHPVIEGEYEEVEEDDDE